MRLPMLIITLVLLSSIAQAAVIQGNIYDLDLKKIDNVLISINTVPKQVFVANNGSYSIDVPKGNYVLDAKNAEKDLFMQTQVIVQNDGDFTLDLILIPSLEEINYLDEYENITDLEINPPEKTSWTAIIISIISIAIVIFIIVRKFKTANNKKEAKTSNTEEPKKQEEKSDIERVIKILKKEGGRITQRDLREQLGDMSEAKVSLLITELESNNQVKKIKKGRGNIIILN